VATSIFETIKRYQREYPVNIRAMAKALGLVVHDVSMPDNISGILVKVGRSFYIKVNNSHHENRRRFTIAHEIAHFVLHADLIISEVVDDAFYRSPQIASPLESRANAYAAELLMPRDLVIGRYDQLIRHGSHDIVSRMAQDFGVSQQAMSIRLSNIRQIEMPFG
jgi:Zn-dependent peptidase ImmA (M78 family)